MAGSDATQDFEDVGHSREAIDTWLPNYLIGKIKVRCPPFFLRAAT